MSDQDSTPNEPEQKPIPASDLELNSISFSEPEQNSISASDLSAPSFPPLLAERVGDDEPQPPGAPGLDSETWDSIAPGAALKGTGFSPYIPVLQEGGALAPEGNAHQTDDLRASSLSSETWDSDLAPSEPVDLFSSWSQPEAVPPARIPHLGHLALLSAFLLFGFACMSVLILLAVHLHWDGVKTLDQIKSNVHYLLGSEAILYLATFIPALIVFPLLWKKSFFAGIQWRGATALRLSGRLAATALGCFFLAAIDDWLLPGPAKAPIEDIFRTPGAAWLMFGFGVTFAPFFEEMAFRGFLLPSLATAWDWTIEKCTGQSARPLDENGHPQWSLPAMAAASILTSLPFALMHAEQTSWSLGPFLLLIVVSLILCAVRLKTRSLAASTLVHACYNFLLFTLMLIGTDGFRHLEKM